MNNKTWQASPVLGVRQVRQTAEYYRDVLGFSFDPVDCVFQPSPDEPDGVSAIVKRPGVWIHFQIRRGDVSERTRPAFERDVYLYVDDLDGLHAELQSRGAVIREPPHMAPMEFGRWWSKISMGTGLRLASFNSSCGDGRALGA